MYLKNPWKISVVDPASGLPPPTTIFFACWKSLSLTVEVKNDRSALTQPPLT